MTQSCTLQIRTSRAMKINQEIRQSLISSFNSLKSTSCINIMFTMIIINSFIITIIQSFGILKHIKVKRERF